MADENQAEPDLPTLEDSLAYIRGNYNELYPIDESRRKTIGNLPERLHDEIHQMAVDRNLRMFEILAGMFDFFKEYESEFSDVLTEQRAQAKGRR